MRLRNTPWVSGRNLNSTYNGKSRPRGQNLTTTMSEGTELAKTQKGEIVYTPLGEAHEIKISKNIIQKHIAKKTKSGQVPGDSDIYRFMALCKARELNPFLDDAYLLGYDTKDGPVYNIITAKSAMDKRADLHHEFDGYESGICVLADGKLDQREGAVHMLGEEIVGAWCSVYRKDRSRPVTHSINRMPYDSGKSRWAIDPAGMLIKCAEAGALRKAFPNIYQGLYLEEEIDASHQKERNITPAPAASNLESLLPPRDDSTAEVTQSAQTEDTSDASEVSPDPLPKVEETPAEGPTSKVDMFLTELETQGVPRDFVPQTLALIGYEHVTTLDDLTDEDVDKLSKDPLTIVETYQFEFGG